jgi:hypothetical protein
MSKRAPDLREPRMEITMNRLLILTALASLYAMAGRLLAELHAASLPVWLDPTATSRD